MTPTKNLPLSYTVFLYTVTKPKKLNYFIYVLVTKHYCVIKLGKFKRDQEFLSFYMKIIVTTILKDLVTNSLLSSFCPVLQTKNKNPVVSKLAAW